MVNRFWMPNDRVIATLRPLAYTMDLHILWSSILLFYYTTYFLTMQCNLDLVSLNLVTTWDLVYVIFQFTTYIKSFLRVSVYVCSIIVWSLNIWIGQLLATWTIKLKVVKLPRYHRLRTPREEIAFTAWPKIHSHCQIFRYGRSTFCLPHRPNFSDNFDLCLHWVSVVCDTYHDWWLLWYRLLQE